MNEVTNGIHQVNQADAVLSADVEWATADLYFY